ncbi:MAG: 4Fe-4S binding protein, partial [Elusimicrobiota bacterium]|nr:4Fe-4S binding protein [Elusimicrobiota bacterium]
KCSATKLESRKKIAEILGQQIPEIETKVAVILCSGGSSCIDKFDYRGVKTCQAASLIFRGHKACVYGCLGFGDCALVCPFDAISYIEGEVPVVDRRKCTGCGICVEKCPKKIIALIPEKYNVHVRCSSLDRGDWTRKICKTGCISCGICVKVCPVKAIEIENNLAKINYSTCSVCGLCVDRCPSNAIERGLQTLEV